MSDLYDDTDLLGIGPSEDDDDDDIDVDLLDDIEDEVEADKQANKPVNPPSTTSSYSPWNSSGWKGTDSNTYQQQPHQNPTIFPNTWGNNQTSNQPQWGNYRPGGWNNWGNNGQVNNTPTWGNSGSSWVNNGSRQNLPRQKKIVMCDLLDNVIEPLSAQGKIGIHPQGIYDMRIKFEVLDRFKAINPEFLFILTNQNFTPGTAASKVYKAMIDYLVFSIAEYMRLPYENVRCITKTGYDIQDPNVKPNTGLIQLALKTIPDVTKRFKKEDILICGMASGMAGQGNRDIEMARKFGVDYIDIQELLNRYV